MGGHAKHVRPTTTEMKPVASHALLEALVSVPLLIITLYKVTGGDLDQWQGWRQKLSAIFFLVLNHSQIVSLIGTAEVRWPSEVLSTFRVFSTTSSLDVSFKLDCLGFPGIKTKLLLHVLMPPAILVSGYLIMFSSWWASSCYTRDRIAMATERVDNVYFSIVYAFCISVVTVSLSFFYCASNPNGTWSLVADRSLLCYQDEWNQYLPVAVASPTNLNL